MEFKVTTTFRLASGREVSQVETAGSIPALKRIIGNYIGEFRRLTVETIGEPDPGDHRSEG